MDSAPFRYSDGANRINDEQCRGEAEIMAP